MWLAACWFIGCGGWDTLRQALDDRRIACVARESRTVGTGTVGGMADWDRAYAVIDEWLADSLHDGQGKPCHTVVMTGDPGSGKTTVAVQALMRALRRFGSQRAVMVVSGRVAADRLGSEVIRELGVLAAARPVTTLSAVAFRLVTAASVAQDGMPPKLLNGAEQDAVLREVLAVHVMHARQGEWCDTCMMLREYFADEDWMSLMVSQRGAVELDACTPEHMASVVARGINDALVVQLRDMLARLYELAVDAPREAQLLQAVEGQASSDRLRVQWRVAFAIRREYEELLSREYTHERRLDASRLIAEAWRAVGQVPAEAVPAVLVVDDGQDVTLAQLALIERLRDAGTRVLFVANPDESVQTFRGAYPDYVLRRMAGDGAATAWVTLPSRCDESHRYIDVVASRVSLSIASATDADVPVADRPGKMPKLPGSWPPMPLPFETEAGGGDGSVRTALYRSDAEEMDQVVWRIKRMRLDGQAAWNDMAIIAHDNTMVRAYGERLRSEGVPVRYSSVTRPLRDEPTVQGLFALVELAQMRQSIMDEGRQASWASMAREVRSRVSAVMNSPLVALPDVGGNGWHRAQLSVVHTAMAAVCAMAALVGRESVADGEVAPVERLVRGWDRLRSVPRRESASGIRVDDSVMSPQGGDGEELRDFDMDACYLMLAYGDVLVPPQEESASEPCGEDCGRVEELSAQCLQVLEAMCANRRQMQVFRRVWSLVEQVRQALQALPERTAQYALMAAWQACDVARQWQREALFDTAQGRAANDRLDAVMRLFDYASGSMERQPIGAFIAQVQHMTIEADSLAKVAPAEDAVTLTTPSGAAGRHWPMVWIVAVQQDVWPNLMPRGVLFGGTDMASMMMSGRLPDSRRTPQGMPDERLAVVLADEQKSWLVALTRATQTVWISATANDDTVPSDFLYTYLPERYSRTGACAATDTGVVSGLHGAGDAERWRSMGLDADPRGVATLAKMTLFERDLTGDRARDAARALAVLADRGVSAATSWQWAYVDPGTSLQVRRLQSDKASTQDTPVVQAMSVSPDAPDTPGVSWDAGESRDSGGSGDVGDAGDSSQSQLRDHTVLLSPSSVDSLWQCPVCWKLEKQCLGPQPSGAQMSIGSLVHEVLQWASEQGLDRIDESMLANGGERLIDKLAKTLYTQYEERAASHRAAWAADMNAEQRYGLAAKQSNVEAMMRRAACYMVNSARPDYGGKLGPIGRVLDVQCEVPFAAQFGWEQMVQAMNAVEGMPQCTVPELMTLMGVLVGGWPEGMDERLRIRISGRLDRLEVRQMPDGQRHCRIIDWKTGSKRNSFDDLQLACYQLGWHFPVPGEPDALADLPPLSRCMLFHVGKCEAPASSRAAETLYQPAMLVDGHIDVRAYEPRPYFPTVHKLMPGMAAMPSQAPEGIRDELWQAWRVLWNTQGLWALTMLARIWYAAAASVSDQVVGHPDGKHRSYCRYKEVCPACGEGVATILERR